MATVSPRPADCDIDPIAYADGDLDEPERARMEAHLRSCPACRQRLATSRWIGQLLREQTPLRDDPAGRAVVRARVEAASRGPSLRLVFAGPWPAATSLLLVLALLASQAWWRGPGPDTGPTADPIERPAAMDSGHDRRVWLWPAYDPIWLRAVPGQLARTPAGSGAPGLGSASDRLLGAPLQRQGSTPGRRTWQPSQRWCAGQPMSRSYQLMSVTPGSARTPCG